MNTDEKRESINSSVQFNEGGNEGGWPAVKYYRDPNPPKMIQWLMKLSGGLISSERKATFALLILALAVFALSLFIFFTA